MFRLFDIVIAGFFLLFLSPLIFLLCMILFCTGEGEIFFKQIRIGFHGKEFKIYKFATMLKNSPNTGFQTLTMKNDPRVLTLGRILRKTKINELPQLLNILFGDMSIVGPRPLTREGELNYKQEQANLIRSVRPGITGIGSLILRDEESYYAHRADAKKFYIQVISPYKASLEIWYINHVSFYLNFVIIINTAMVIIWPSWNVRPFFKSLPDMPIEMIASKSKHKI